MAEAGDDLAAAEFFGRGAGLGLLDDRGEVCDVVAVRLEVRDAGGAGKTGGIDAVPVRLFRGKEFSAGDDDGAVEFREVFCLRVQRAAVVAGKVVDAGELRIAVGRHEVVVGVDIDAGVFRLGEQTLQGADVVAADQDAGVFPDTQLDIGDFRRTVPLDAGVVQKAHGTVAEPADFHGQVEQKADAEGELQGPLEDALQERIDALILIADLIGVVGKGRNALQSGQNDAAEALRVRVLILLFRHFGQFCLILLGARGVPERVDGQDPGRRDIGEQGPLDVEGLFDGAAEHRLIRVHALHGHAEVAQDEQVRGLRHIFHLDT